MHDDFGDRMKAYENVNRNYLIPRMPIMIRMDGKSFHTYTEKFKKPYDTIIINSMKSTALSLLKSIQGAEIAFVQSDEITLFLNTYKTLKTDSWFGGNIQKITSVSAAMASVNFSNEIVHAFIEPQYCYFDSRCFNLPKEEVYNNFLWRANDATKNAVQCYARYKFGHLACVNLKTGELLNLIPEEEWVAANKHFKFGTLYYKDGREIVESSDYIRNNKEQIEKLVYEQE